MRLFAFLALFIPALSIADDIQLSWGIPDQRIDGSPLEAHEIDGYSIKYSYNNTTRPEIRINGALTLETVINDVQAGVYVFQIATVSGGQTGPYSETFTLPLSAIQKTSPQAPVFRVHLSCDNCNLEVK